jgi:phosphoribosylamine--glycine ligase
MRVLLLGSGGREAALAWSLARSSGVEVFAAPGNPGMTGVIDYFDIDACNGDAVMAVASKVSADLVVVGPEAPLVAGIGDVLSEEGYPVFGPSAAAARIEGSKSFAKDLMTRAGIPTAAGATFSTVNEAVAYMDRLGPPYVVKADGLAAGKGVVVTGDRDLAVEAVTERIELRRFGAAGASVVIEEFLDGPEASLIAFSDGTNVIACEPAQDYKRVGDGDEGPNTGGMGSYSPVPDCPTDVAGGIVAQALEPMVAACAAAGHPFIGALYAGVALTNNGPRIVEFNARFGDPETQALLPRLTSDLAEVCLASATGALGGCCLSWSHQPCVSVVLASSGYPDGYSTGYPIQGIESARQLTGTEVFTAGVGPGDDGLTTAGGRVLAVSALGDDFDAARQRVYQAAEQIGFEGKFMRSDIAARPGGKSA